MVEIVVSLMPTAVLLTLSASAGDETFYERHGKPIDTSTFSGRFAAGRRGPAGKPTTEEAFPRWTGSAHEVAPFRSGDGLRVQYTDLGALAELLGALTESGIDAATKAMLDL